MGTPKQILNQALKMNPSEKYIIIEGLLNSLDEPDKTIDEIWAIEAEKRLNAYKAGQTKVLSFKRLKYTNEGN